MTCKQANLLIAAYADGEVSAAESAAIRSHLHDCEACHQSHRELMIVRSVMKLEPKAVPIPEGLETRLKASLPRPQRKLVLVASLAAVCVVASLLIPAMVRPASNPDRFRSLAIRQEIARDRMSSFGADPTEGASVVHYANFNSAGR
jgi:predicted anti-sigma-YlaC factor YlaD